MAQLGRRGFSMRLFSKWNTPHSDYGSTGEKRVFHAALQQVGYAPFRLWLNWGEEGFPCGSSASGIRPIPTMAQLGRRGFSMRFFSKWDTPHSDYGSTGEIGQPERGIGAAARGPHVTIADPRSAGARRKAMADEF